MCVPFFKENVRLINGKQKKVLSSLKTNEKSNNSARNNRYQIMIIYVNMYVIEENGNPINNQCSRQEGAREVIEIASGIFEAKYTRKKVVFNLPALSYIGIKGSLILILEL